MSRLEREYADLEEVWKAEKAQVQGSQAIKEELEKVRLDMDEARRKGDWQKMSELRYGKLPQLEARLHQAESGEGTQTTRKLLRTQVGAEEIAEVVSRATGIPVSKMMQGEREKLVLLQVLDDGRLTDGQGRTVDFKNTVVVMTSNLGSQQIQAMSDSDDYQMIKLAVMAEVVLDR